MALPSDGTGTINGVSQMKRDEYYLTAAEAAANRRFQRFDDESKFPDETCGYYVYPGSPESNVTANKGSWCSDTVNGVLYVKTTDTANTGWKIIDSNIEDLHTAKYIVSSEPNIGGNYTTITSAITAAQASGLKSTIFIMPGLTGIYTEDFTLPANINLCAYDCDATTPNVTIKGKITCTDAGSRSISGIRLETNGDFCLVVSGTLATVVNLNNCHLNITNNTSIQYTSTSASSVINVYRPYIVITSVGITVFNHSSSGTLNFLHISRMGNSGLSTTASTCSAGSVYFSFSRFTIPITTSGTGNFSADYLNMDTNNSTCLTVEGSGNGTVNYGVFNSGSSPALHINTAFNLYIGQIFSNNVNATTGAGSLTYGEVIFTGTSSLINTTTTVRRPLSVLQGGTGLTSTTANQLLYSSSSNTLAGLTGGNNLIAATNNSGTLAMRAFSINTQAFTSNGTYTPSSGMIYCIIEVIGGGAGGGGVAAQGVGNTNAAGGGGSGGYSRKSVSSSTIGASQSVTVGLKGTGGAAGANNGNNGGTSSVGAIVSATGGTGGLGAIATNGGGVAGGAGGVGSSGDFNANGGAGGAGFSVWVTATFSGAISGKGGDSVYGGGAKSVTFFLASKPGENATNYGSGGSGAGANNELPAAAGGDGSDGIVIITEYIIN